MTSFTSRMALAALAAAFSVSSFGAAEARDRGAKPAVHRADDFYALSNTAETPAAPAAESHGCFTTNNSMEAAKGIRHWSGRC